MDVKQVLFSPFSPLAARIAEAQETLMSLYWLSLSNALTGYAYRTVEEVIYEEQGPRMPETERERLLNSMFRECAADLNEGGYRTLRQDDVVDRRLLLCLALRWNNHHLPYILADNDEQARLWGAVFSQNLQLSENCYVRVFASLGMLKKDRGLSDTTRDQVRDGVQQDLLHGYIVKLSESLDAP
jgi:hypothetical protein